MMRLSMLSFRKFNNICFSFRCFLFLVFFQLFFSNCDSTNVKIYPAPKGEELSGEYKVLINDKELDVYKARTLDPPFANREWDYGGDYSFASFDFSGKVSVQVSSKRSLRNVIIRPRSKQINPVLINDTTIRFSLKNAPIQLSIEPDGKNAPLLFFANPIEKTTGLDMKNKNTIYMGPGIHHPGIIELNSNQTLYLAGGAIVHAAILINGENIKIKGRGILDGSEWSWGKGPRREVISIKESTNVKIEGIIIRGAYLWTVVPDHSNKVIIDNIKICNSRVQNDDGINPCNSQNVTIKNSFIRSDDDCIALKGFKYLESNNNIENIIIENCVFWSDRARVFLLGHESRARFMQNITFKNIDIIHFAMTPFLLEPGEDMLLQNVLIEDIRINGEGQKELIRLRPVINQYMYKQVPGRIRNVRIKNINVYGKKGEYSMLFSGTDSAHNVSDITIEEINMLGTKLTNSSEEIKIRKFVENFKFLP